MNFKINQIADNIAENYWIDCTKYERKQYCFRFTCLVKIVEQYLGSLKGKSTIDIGGGWGFFSAICSSMGSNSLLIDDFQDLGFKNSNDVRKKLPEKFGFQVKSINISGESLSLKKNFYDLITTFDVLEHLHHSPRTIIFEAYEALKEGGVLIIGVPNCVRLSKRISTLVGKAKWSGFNDYFFSDVFRGHVREYSVEDLRQIAKYLDIDNYEIIGRNFNGIESSKLFIRSISKILFHILKPVPKLCDSIFLILKKQY